MDAEELHPPEPEPASEPEPSPLVMVQPPKRHTGVIVALVVIVVLLIAGVAFAFISNVWPFQPAMSDDELIRGLSVKLSEIDYVKYGLALSVTSQARAPGAQPLTQELLNYDKTNPNGNSTDSVLPLSLLGGLPSDVDVQLHVDGASQNVSVKGLGTEFKAGAAVKAGDFTIEADGDFRIVGQDYYVRVNKFPGIFIDLGPIKGKWIRVTKDDLSGTGYDFASELTNFGSEEGAQSARISEQIQKIYTLGLDSGFFHLTPLTTKDITVTKGVRRFTTSTDAAKLADFYKSAAEALASYGDKAMVKYDPATFALLQTPDFQKFYAYLASNGNTEIWIDQNGYPVKLTNTFMFIPDDAYAPNLKAVQFAITESLRFSDINTQVSVEAPADAISYEDASIAMSKMSPETYRAAQQANRISTLRSSLSNYQRIVGAYPAALTDLGKTPKELGVASESGQYGYEIAFQKTIPLDYFTKVALQYEKQGSDYNLTYTMNLPPQSTESNADRLYQSFVQGTNHANAEFLSVEKKSVY